MAKDKVTNSEYLQLVGLFVLAAQHTKALENIEKAAAEIVGQEDEEFGGYGHVSDAIYDTGSRPVDVLLKKMNIQKEE